MSVTIAACYDFLLKIPGVSEIIPSPNFFCRTRRFLRAATNIVSLASTTPIFLLRRAVLFPFSSSWAWLTWWRTFSVSLQSLTSGPLEFWFSKAKQPSVRWIWMSSWFNEGPVWEGLLFLAKFPPSSLFLSCSLNFWSLFTVRLEVDAISFKWELYPWKSQKLLNRKV